MYRNQPRKSRVARLELEQPIHQDISFLSGKTGFVGIQHDLDRVLRASQVRDITAQKLRTSLQSSHVLSFAG